MKASAKGSYGKISDYQVRDVDGVYWLPESVPEPVCNWKDFLVIWKKEFPYLKILNSCEDTCGECFKIKNSFTFGRNGCICIISKPLAIPMQPLLRPQYRLLLMSWGTVTVMLV